MSKEEAETVEASEDTQDNELESYFDDEDSNVEADAPAEEETQETESEEEESEEVEESEEETNDDDQEEEAEDSSEAETQESESEEDTDSEEQDQDKSKDKPESDIQEDKSKDELAQEAFKRREAERKLREAEEKSEAERLQRYLDEAEEDEVELKKRQIEVQQYVLQKERSQLMQDKLDVGINKAVAELKLTDMDEPTKNYLARRLDDFETSRVIKDKSGNILEVRGDVYQYIKDEMDSISQFRSVGAREQAKKKQTEKARTVKTPTRTPKEKPVDPDLAAFDEEADMY